MVWLSGGVCWRLCPAFMAANRFLFVNWATTDTDNSSPPSPHSPKNGFPRSLFFGPSVFKWIYPYTRIHWQIAFSLSIRPTTNTNKTILFSFSLDNWVSEDPITKDRNNRHPWITLNIHPVTTTLYREVKRTIEFHKPLWQKTGFIDTPRPDTRLNNIHPWTKTMYREVNI